MARMIPESLSPETPASERFVYKRLEAGLPESWTVIHGRRFFLPGNPPVEGELDFLVIDPSRGGIGLEVKGGGVERTHDGWFSTDRNQTRHAIKDPGRQASQAIHAIHEVRDAFQARGQHVGEAPAQVVGRLGAVHLHGQQHQADAVLGGGGAGGQ